MASNENWARGDRTRLAERETHSQRRLITPCLVICLVMSPLQRYEDTAEKAFCIATFYVTICHAASDEAAELAQRCHFISCHTVYLGLANNGNMEMVGYGSAKAGWCPG